MSGLSTPHAERVGGGDHQGLAGDDPGLDFLLEVGGQAAANALAAEGRFLEEPHEQVLGVVLLPAVDARALAAVAFAQLRQQ